MVVLRSVINREHLQGDQWRGGGRALFSLSQLMPEGFSNGYDLKKPVTKASRDVYLFSLSDIVLMGEDVLTGSSNACFSIVRGQYCRVQHQWLLSYSGYNILYFDLGHKFQKPL